MLLRLLATSAEHKSQRACDNDECQDEGTVLPNQLPRIVCSVRIGRFAAKKR
jgi:hypothetical protein